MSFYGKTLKMYEEHTGEILTMFLYVLLRKRESISNCASACITLSFYKRTFLGTMGVLIQLSVCVCMCVSACLCAFLCARVNE